MAAIGRNEHDFVIVSGAVFRGLVDLALEDSGLSELGRELLLGARDVKGVSLDLVPTPQRAELESALKLAVQRAINGERSDSSGPDVESGETLIRGAERVQGFL